MKNPVRTKIFIKAAAVGLFVFIIAFGSSAKMSNSKISPKVNLNTLGGALPTSVDKGDWTHWSWYDGMFPCDEISGNCIM